MTFRIHVYTGSLINPEYIFPRTPMEFFHPRDLSLEIVGPLPTTIIKESVPLLTGFVGLR